ncbi:MAG: YceI family protein, partial [Chakrabartia sp.]
PHLRSLKMRPTLPLLALMFATPLIATALVAQGTPPEVPGKVDPARVTGGTYQVESTHAIVAWKVSHFGFNDYYGMFGSPTGTLTLDKADMTKSSVTIDIPLGELYTVNAKLTEHMKGKDFFDSTVNKSAKFVSSSITVDGMKAKIVGNLTLLGQTKPVTLDATFTGAGTNPYNKKETVGFKANTSINRSDFGMKYGIPMVTDKVDLAITVAFEK